MQDRGAGQALRPRAGARRYGLVAGVAALAVAADQATKAWALDALEGGRTVDLVWTLRFRLVFNRGSAFGLLDGFAPFFALGALVAVLLLLLTGRGIRATAPLVALGLVIGGAVGNLTDRVGRAGSGLLGGPVVDFVDLQWWPVFNLADAAIVVGAVLLALTAAGDDR